MYLKVEADPCFALSLHVVTHRVGGEDVELLLIGLSLLLPLRGADEHVTEKRALRGRSRATATTDTYSTLHWRVRDKSLLSELELPE